MEGFLRYQFGGLIFGGAYTWWGLFSEFTVFSIIISNSLLAETYEQRGDVFY